MTAESTGSAAGADAASPVDAAPGGEPMTGSGSASAPERSRTVVVIVVIALLLALGIAVLRGSYRDGPLEPSAPTAQGALAVSSVLRDTGTDVDTVRTTADAVEALHAGRTVILTRPGSLAPGQLRSLRDAVTSGSGQLVLVQPMAGVTAALAPGVRPAGTVPVGTQLEADAECGDASWRARSIEPSLRDPEFEEDLVATVYTVPDDARGCFRSDRGAAVVREGDVTVLAGPGLLMNAGVDSADNAAIALNLADGHDVSWYLPSPLDPASGSSPTLLDRIPDWVLPLALWLCLCVLLALVAAFHRLGPAVVEPLPVTVRSQELTIGRAGLMQRAGARGAAAESLRAAACVRLAARLGLRREESLEALILALAPHTSRSPEDLRALLGTTVPATDSDLVRLAQELDRLEKEIDR